ncbi:MAG: metallophosphoesterase, partial [Ruminococcus sp.]|nr:metallophosphoesterase [Candidatus Copronaster equi]
LDVVGFWGKGEKCRKNVKKAINGLFGVVDRHNIPFAVTFGNHDRETGISNDEQAKIYSEFKNCFCFDNLNDGRPDSGTYNIEILSSDEASTALNVYVFDSQSKLKLGSYDSIKSEQIEWYKNKSHELKNKNNGKPIKSIVFQHIPVSEIYDLLKKVPKKTTGALPAYNNHKDEYYILDDEKIFYSGEYGETPASPDVNSGQFEALKNQGDVFAMYFGHDHYNSFIGKVDGIDLGYCPGAGFNVYGIKGRGMRVFDFDEADVTSYKTKVIGYKDVCKKSYAQPLRNFILTLIPSSTHAIPEFAAKVIPVLLAIILLLILAYRFISRKLVIALLGILLGAGILYSIFAFIRISILKNKINRKDDRK